MISIVCIFNNEKILNKYLLESLKKQTKTFELITLDNTNNQFESAAKAMNYGIKIATGEYVMFVHQDVDLCSKNWLENVEVIINSLSNVGVVGVAGKNEKGVASNIKHGKPPILAGKKLNKPLKVQTLDECLIIVPKNILNKFKFDEEVCDDWHLYTVDYCLQLLKNNLDIYVIPIFIYHASAGYSISNNYFIILKNILKKYKNDYNCIYTTVWNWNNSNSFFLQKIWYMFRLQISKFNIFIYKKFGIYITLQRYNK